MPPVVDGQVITFRWRIEPISALYRKTSFTLTFPGSIDLSRVPDRLWWDIALICLHPHWLLLRPCQVRLPLRLADPERRFWLQLLQNGVDTLAAYGPERLRSEPLGIEIIGGELDVPRTPIEGSRCGTAFSSGKDSLLQAGLLCELTDHPLLVTTTSPLPPLADHVTQRRRQVLADIGTRRKVTLVDVVSDFRSTWDNAFAGRLGYPLAVNELTDTFLYLSSLLAAGAAIGATRLFLASEAELQVNALLGGRIVQHSHFMYSAATQRALGRLLAPYGIRFGSLIWPLQSMQVQQLLWTRYPDLCDLQYSCWRVRPGESTCSRCEQCLRVAVTALASGEDPSRMGIDVHKILAFAPAWEQKINARATPVLPQDGEAQRLDARVMDTIRRVPPAHLAAVLARGKFWRFASRARALRAFRRVQKRALESLEQPPLGVKEAFFDWLDPELRAPLIAIYTHHFPREPRERHLGYYERSETLTRRATSVLD
jgi:hypothetical protein